MLAALCLAMVFAISLSSYIALCYASLNMSTRTVAIAHCNELGEAGVEQALYSLNTNDWSLWSVSGTTATANLTMTASGFAPTSLSPTPLNYGNGINGTVQVTVNNYTNYQNNASPGPSISSQATMTLPAYQGGTSAPTISSTTTYNASTSPATAAVPVFVNAVAAVTGTVRFRSAGTVDSYNSYPPPYTGYVNYAAQTPGYSAVVLSQDNTTAAASVRLGNAQVHGYAVGYNYFYPSTTNWLSYSASGKVVGPNTLPATFIDSTRLVTSPVPYQPFVVEKPVGSLTLDYPSLPSSVSTDTTTFNKTATIGLTTSTRPIVYNAGTGINLASKILTVQGPVIIICYSNVVLSGTGQIILSTPQASLQIFLEYGNLTLGGNGIVNTNAYPLPKKLCILSTTNQWGTATFSVPPAYPFYGEIYLPYMTLSVTSSPVIYGSLVASSISFIGSPTIHYDRALRSPTGSYSMVNPQLSGAAFDNLSAPATFGTLATTMQ
jgi:hypothetical protein